MKCYFLRTLAVVLCGATLAISTARGQDSRTDRREQTNHQNDSNREHRSDDESQSSNGSESADDDETEYRGMEHAAMGVMLSERSGKGVRIRDLLADSPAERAGLRVGDKITKIDDKPMKAYGDVVRYINRVKPGQKAEVTVDRDGNEKTIEVRFSSHEELFGDDSNEQWENSSQQNRQYRRRQQGDENQYGRSRKSYSQDSRYQRGQYDDGQYQRQDQYGYGRSQQGQFGQNDANYGFQQGYNTDRNLQRTQQRGMDSRQNFNSRNNSSSGRGSYGQESYGRDNYARNNSDRDSSGQGGDRQEGYGQGSYSQGSYGQGSYGRASYGQGQWQQQDSSRQQLDQNQAVLGVDFDNQQDAIVVRNVWPGSPAEQAGLRRGDEITSVNGEDVDDQDDIMEEIRNCEPGERLRLTVNRNGQERTVRARLASRQELSNQGRDNQGRQYRNNEWRSDDNTNSDRTAGRMRLRQAQRSDRWQDGYEGR